MSRLRVYWTVFAVCQAAGFFTLAQMGHNHLAPMFLGMVILLPAGPLLLFSGIVPFPAIAAVVVLLNFTAWYMFARAAPRLRSGSN